MPIKDSNLTQLTAPGAPQSPPTPPGQLPLTEAEHIFPEPIEWLWPGRLAKGKLTILQGDPGVGKSTLAIDIAARITTGEPFPGEEEEREPQLVTIFASEDGLGDTLMPRLMAAGADLSYVSFFEVSTTVPNFVLPRDVKLLPNAVGLIIFDPLLWYLDPGIRTHIDAEVRQALVPLAEQLQASGVPAIGVMHLNKGGGVKAIYRGGGSIAFGAVSRIVMLADEDPDDEGGYILASTKCNIFKKVPSLKYAIEEKLVSNREMGYLGDLARDNIPTSRVTWGGESHLSANDLLQAQQEKNRPGPKPESREVAARWLKDFLSEPKKRSDVVEAASKVAINEKTLQRAASGLGVKSVKAEGNWKERIWSMPTPNGT